MQWAGPEITDELVFQVVEKIVEGKKATQIANEMQAQGVTLNREQVYVLLNRAVERGFLRLCAPLDHTLTSRLSERYPQAHVRVVNVPDGSNVVGQVAAAGAQLVLSLVKQLGQTQETVRLGLAAGNTLKMLSRELGILMRAEPELPHLVLQALSSGPSIKHPTRAPTSFFTFFQDLPVDVRFVGLFSAAVVQWNEFEQAKKLPGIQEAFKEKKHIDIVVMSMASANDEHGLYNHFMGLGKKSAVNKLRRAGWVGDVHWHPFSEKGPIKVNTGVRSMTLFELDELAEWAARTDKHIVLMAAPCGQCGRTKSDALRPLLEEPALRVYNHLVTDVRTARELL